jgi:NADH-quinone oxidoreductase subunit C
MSDRIEKIRKALEGKAKNWREHHGGRFYCDVAPEKLVEVARLLFENHGLRLATASGLDGRSHMEILYHFSADSEGAFISLRVSLPKNELEVDSLAPFMKAAEWVEREIHEMLGITFKGHPDLRHLLLSDDWPEGKFPLRRDY